MARTTKQIGNEGEALAARYYISKGYTVIADNYIVGGGELDLVLYRRGTLVFAEVKTRTSDAFGRPFESVDAKKIEHLVGAERAFVAQNIVCGKIPVYSKLLRRMIRRRVFKIRNDVAEVYPADKPIINIIKNAFEAEL